MQSPFKIFRKHQKQMLVALFIMAMLAFVVGDAFMRMQRMWSVRHSSPTVVETKAGKLSQDEIGQLVQKRRTIRQFIELAYLKTHPELRKSPWFGRAVANAVSTFGFGGESQQDVLYAWLYRQEAKKMGIVVSDDQIEAYIRQFTNRKLTSKKFMEVLREMQMRVGAKELYDMFRDELQAYLAYRTRIPADLVSPEKYWDYYQQVNTREKIIAAALPVKDFSDQVPEPTEKQLADFFSRHENETEVAANGEFKPGFKQQRKVNIQYLTLSYASVEAEVRAQGPISDEDVEAYYEENKNIDKNLYETGPVLPDDSTPIDPDISPEPPPLPGQEQAPDSEKEPVEQKEQKEPEDLPPPGDDKPETKGDPCGVAPEDEDAEDKDPPAKKDAAAEDLTLDDDTDKSGAAAEKAEPGTEHGIEPPVAPDPNADKKKEPPKVNIRYKPLSDELREQIRETLVEKRTRALMKERTDNAKEAMVEAGLRFSTSGDVKLISPTPEQSANLVRRAEAELRKIAETFGMKFDQTGLVSMVELSELPGIGKAQESGANQSFMRDATIVDLTFGDSNLARTFRAENVETSDVYLGWKVQDVAAHVPKLTDPGVREQVLAAWKRVESLPLARKRAEELAERARQSDKDFEQAFTGETVTGDPLGLAVFVSPESNEFSFWRESSAPNPFGGEPPVQLGNPIVVNNPGRKFMQVVFDELAEGDIGVVLNNDASVYYVVKVVSRRPADREAFKNAPLFGRLSPYGYLAELDRQLVQSEFARRIHDEYAVKWLKPASEEMTPGYEEE